MTQYAILTDVNKCVGCLACSISCKVTNDVPVGSYWNKVLRIGPNPRQEGGQWPDVYTYFLTMQCQHCEDPECVKVCPTGASHKLADGTVQVDKEKCIGCQYCIYACPYGVRSFSEEDGVARKCTLCQHLTADGKADPACVHNCPGGARFYGDLDDPDFDLPLNEKGHLDVDEWLCQEFMFQIPTVLLCSADCPGLCPRCGKKMAECTCPPAEAEAEPADARLAILKSLLN